MDLLLKDQIFIGNYIERRRNSTGAYRDVIQINKESEKEFIQDLFKFEEYLKEGNNLKELSGVTRSGEDVFLWIDSFDEEASHGFGWAWFQVKLLCYNSES